MGRGGREKEKEREGRERRERGREGRRGEVLLVHNSEHADCRDSAEMEV